MLEYAALVASPRALPGSLILVFHHPVINPANGSGSGGRATQQGGGGFFNSLINQIN